jgi:hypothetical protein
MPGNAKKKCPKAGNLYVELRRQRKENPKKWDKLAHNCALKLTGGQVDSPDASTQNNTTYKNLCARGYSLLVKPDAEEATFAITEKIEQKGKVLQTETNVGVGYVKSGVTIEDQKTRMHYYRLYPLILRVVVEDDHGKKVEGITVTVTGGPEQIKPITTDKNGLADFGYVKKAQYTLDVTLPADKKEGYKVKLPAPKGEGMEGKVDAQQLGKEPYKVVIAAILRVYLKLLFKEPKKDVKAEAKARPFPKDFSFKLHLDHGSAMEVKLGADGQLLDKNSKAGVEVERKAKAFTLDFGQKESAYIVCEKSDADPPTQDLVHESDPAAAGTKFRDAVDKGHRAFKLPVGVWTLKNSDWTVPKDQKYSDHKFTGLEDHKTTIGKPGAPVELVLDPHWHFYRFEFFDRYYGHSNHSHKPISILSVELAGHSVTPHASPEPQADTYSNWTFLLGNDAAKSVQCLPWIIQKKHDGSHDPKPDKHSQLLFSTKANSFIFSESATLRKTVILDAARPADAAKLKPSADRLKYYDLPAIWRSSHHWCRLSDAEADHGFWADMAAKATAPDKPLIFSLDDIVLTDNAFHPVHVAATDRAAIFANTFAQDNARKLDPLGLYDADTARPYFSKEVKHFKNHINYISDYPAWTRLVIAQGNLFDVFDRRVADGANGPVGARAGVRWVDSPPISKPGSNPPRPAHTRTSEFCIVQPFFEQRHDMWWTPATGDDRGTGRSDMGLLRCCDVGKDGATEIGQCITYFRFSFNFNPAHNPNGNAAIGPDNPPVFNKTHPSTPLNLTGNAALSWNSAACKEIPLRWTGPSTVGAGVMNPGRTLLLPKDAATHKFEIRTFWFVQELPRNIAHYEIGVFKPKPPDTSVRGYMSSDTGYGSLDRPDNKPQASGWFTAAHETGHGGSLGDEYIEPTSPTNLPGPWLDGFDSWSPGSPYALDGDAMMNGNLKVRGRYAWHKAEWLKFLYGYDFQVDHDGNRYELPHLTVIAPRNTTRPYLYSHVNWPMAEAHNALLGVRGQFDAFFYPLGKDAYSLTELPRLAKNKPIAPPPSVAAFDSLLVLLVRIQLNFHVNQNNTIHGWLGQIQGHLDLHYNYKFVVRGTVGGKNFTRCLLHFSPRYYVPNNYSPKAPTSGIAQQFTVNTQAGGSSAWGAAPGPLKYRLTFSINTSPPPGNALNAATLNDFRDLFGQMLGLAAGTWNTAASYNPVVQIVIPGASTSRISN